MNSNHFSIERQSNYDETGKLVINEDGSISQSCGELENDTRTAKIMQSICDAIRLYETLNPSDSYFNNVTLQYEDYCYTLLLSKKPTVIKRRFIRSQTIET